MAINLLTNNADKLEKRLTVGALVFGKGKCKFDYFEKTDTVKSLSVLTQEPNIYNPAASGSRFGALKEVEDTVHEYKLVEGPSNNMSIDKSYNTAQLKLKRAADIMKQQIDEKYIPYMDIKSLAAKVKGAGVTSVDGTLTADNVFKAFTKARKTFVDKKMRGNGKDLVAWVKSDIYEIITEDDRFKTLEKLGTKATTEGVVGKYAGWQIIELPAEYLDKTALGVSADVNFICANLNVIIDVPKFKTARILTEHPDVDGSVIQLHYKFGSFVEETNKEGVYVSYVSSPSI